MYAMLNHKAAALERPRPYRDRVLIGWSAVRDEAIEWEMWKNGKTIKSKLKVLRINRV
jgi:hypothetical protein